MSDLENRKNPFLIIDANSLAHRAYHALPPLRTKEGVLVNAVYGFFSIFIKTIKEFRPGWVAAVFDLPQPTFRHQEFSGYKAKRVKPPDEFYQQLPKIKEILKVLGVPVFEKEGFEADDVIGTLAFLATQEKELLGSETIILSSDNDFLQLVNNRIKVLILKKGVSQSVFYDEQAVQQKYEGLIPQQLVDFKALRGDVSDNIIGVPGVGEKTALKLLLRAKNLTALFSDIEQMGLAESLRQKLITFKEQAFVSQRLARIRCDVPIYFSLADCLWGRQSWNQVAEVFQRLRFFSLLSRLAQVSGKEIK